MRYPLLAVFMIILTVGCATSSKTYTQDGSTGHVINCSGSALNWGMCYEKAGNICKECGFDILEKSSESGNTVSWGQYGLFGGTVMNRSMVITCKECE